jgi:hypothetical protein
VGFFFLSSSSPLGQKARDGMTKQGVEKIHGGYHVNRNKSTTL